MFEQLPSVWERDKPTAENLKSRERLFAIAMGIVAIGCIGQLLSDLFNR